MNALELLKQDHHKVKELFEKAESAPENEKRKLFGEILTELEIHAMIEESIFYPAVEKRAELKDMVLESLEEHKQIKTLLVEIDDLKSDSEKFEPKLKVLMENVSHHAEEEEEGKMFPKLKQLMDEQELEALGRELEEAKGKKQQRKAS